jgi:putative DNA primase/helicase
LKVQFNNIPEGIRGKPLYCLAKLEQKPSKNKPDKIPYQITGARASPNNQGHFKSLAEIEDIFKKGGYDAIGIGVFDSIVVIDIDKCVSNGKLNKFARKIVNKLKFYTEISISGTGIHIVSFASGLVFDKDRYYFNNRKLGLEIYPAGFTKRFIMFTGNIVNKYDVVECTDAVQRVLDTYMVKPNADMKVTVNAPGSYLSDETILAKMFTSANGEKTKALWNGGDDGKSASEGDLALCNILAFWCGGDEEQMNPKTLQYLMGHSDISVTMNVYTHFGFDDAEEELKRMEEFRKAQAEVEKKNEKPMTKRMFKAI